MGLWLEGVGEHKALVLMPPPHTHTAKMNGRKDGRTQSKFVVC